MADVTDICLQFLANFFYELSFFERGKCAREMMRKNIVSIMTLFHVKYDTREIMFNSIKFYLQE